jgi:hypothetical protein
MADNASAATAASSAVSSVTTRSQQQKNGEKAAATAAQAAAKDDDGNPTPTSDHNHKKARELFKGKSDKMSGHVFQLAAEGRKANQFSETIKAFLNDDPCTDVVLLEPPDEPPLGADGITMVSRDH